MTPRAARRSPNGSLSPVGSSLMLNKPASESSLSASATAEATGPSGSLSPAKRGRQASRRDRKSTRLNSSHANISYAVFCLKKKTEQKDSPQDVRGHYSRHSNASQHRHALEGSRKSFSTSRYGLRRQQRCNGT